MKFAFPRFMKRFTNCFMQSTAVIFLMAVSSLSQSVAPAGEASMHEVTGKAAITDDVSPDRARRLALEDALYQAAMQGGAAIDGFSAMDASTILSEEMVLRPTADILDYTIIEEKQEGNHFLVNIQAVTGMADPTACEAGLVRHFTVVAPRIHVSPAAPAWAARQADKLMQHVLKTLPARANAKYELATDTPFDATRRQRTDQSFDYRVLTTAPNIAPGDYVLQLALTLDAMTDETNLMQEEILRATLQVEVFTGQGFTPVFTSKTSEFVHSQPDYFVKTLNQVMRAPRPVFDAAMVASLAGFVDTELGQFLCQALNAKITVEQGRPQVPLGQRHGLATSHLAIVNKSDSPFRVLRISKLSDAHATLSPLNPMLDLSVLDGQHVRFLEAK